MLSNLNVMGKSPLILAALAKAAAPSLNFVKVQKIDAFDSADFDTALLTSQDGKHFLVRIPNTPTAATNQDAELRALKALAKQPSLPFSITSQVAAITTREGETARVFTYVYGSKFDLIDLNADHSLVESSARALAAIHNLPLTVVQDIDFPEYTSSHILKSCAAELDRAMETGKVPSVLLNRWEDALSNEQLFRFMPAVINGLLGEDSVLELDGEISGILNWTDLQIGDPAVDFGWIMARGHEDLIYNLLLAYQSARPSADNNIRQRAKLYSELSWANWLVTALKENNSLHIDEAIRELEILAAEVEGGTALRLSPTGFAAKVAENFAPVAAATATTDEFAEPRGPIFSSYNFDSPVVDFVNQESFDDVDTAPITLPPVAPAQAPPAKAPATTAAQAATPAQASMTLPSFLAEESDKDDLF